MHIDIEEYGDDLILVTLQLFVLLSKSHSYPDVGLRRTCAYYRTSAHAMCMRKCVWKRFGNVYEMCVRAAHF
jgi:hypothetical protein